MSRGWYEHFSKLSSPLRSSLRTAYDDQVELDYDFIASCLQSSLPALPPVSSRDVLAAVQALNLNIAPDIEALTVEHIRFAGTHLLDCLTAIINTILANIDIPHNLKRSHL